LKLANFVLPANIKLFEWL